VTAALAIASLVFTGGCIACLVYLHVSPTGYSPLRNAVSEYGVGAYADWYRVQAACAGTAAILLAGALAKGVHPTPRRVISLLLVFAVARIAIGNFPADLIGAKERTRTGGIHALLAVAAFGSAAWAGGALRHAQHGEPVLGWAMGVFAVGTVLALRRVPLLRPYAGLIERGFYVALLAWLVLVAVRLV
jgi:Protein of unknown function (DUF998)